MCAGVEGRVGPRGTPGAAGNTGFTGAIGPVGAQGPPGATGGVDAQGMRGDVGNAGPIGATGQPGARGLPGTKGPSVATHFSLSLSACRLLCRLEENSIGDNSRALNGRVFSEGTIRCEITWLGSRVVSVLDSGAVGPRVQIAVATLPGNSLRQTVHTHRASVHQAAKLVAAL